MDPRTSELRPSCIPPMQCIKITIIFFSERDNGWQTQQTGNDSLETFHAWRWRRHGCHRVHDARRSTEKWVEENRLWPVDSLSIPLRLRHRRFSRCPSLTEWLMALASSSSSMSRMRSAHVVLKLYGSNSNYHRHLQRIRPSRRRQAILPVEWANLIVRCLV